MRLTVSQTLRSAAVVLMACLAASVAFAQINPSEHSQRNNPGPPAPQNVLVVNGTGQPVPTAPQGTTNVAGTVNVGNTPNVNVANMPSVSIANTPSVTISGTPTVALSPGGSTGVTNPLDSQSLPTPLAVLDAIQPYEDKCVINFGGANQATCFFQTIPSGKRLVIQEFDAGGGVETGLKPTAIVLFTTVGHSLPATFMGTDGLYDDFATHQETRLYAATGVAPSCLINLSGSSSHGAYGCSLAGFLVDVP